MANIINMILDKISKTNGQILAQEDTKKIDDNMEKIQNTFNELSNVAINGDYNDLINKPININVSNPTDKQVLGYDTATTKWINQTIEVSGGSTVTSSSTNGNIKINGNETTVYTHPTGATSTNPHNTTKTDVGLSNVDNTSDSNKPISSATQSALDLKINKNDKKSEMFFYTKNAGVYGVQAISGLSSMPKRVEIRGVATNYGFFNGSWEYGNNKQSCQSLYIFNYSLAKNDNSNIINYFTPDGSVLGKIQNVTTTGFEINWSSSGTVTNDDLDLQIVAFYS